MSVEEFRDNDDGYLNWVAANPGGFVINIQRGLNPSDARLHRSACYTISGRKQRPGGWTGPYIKLCSTDLAELERWASEHARGPITPCGTCQPPRGSILDKPTSIAATQRRMAPIGPTVHASAARDHVRSLRVEVDRILTEARDYLAPVVHGLFIMNGPGWVDRLNAVRSMQRTDLRPFETAGVGIFRDRRVLFAVIRYQWTLIQSGFVRDPSGPARTLWLLASGYAHDEPLEPPDPEAAREAFTELCITLRNDSVQRARALSLGPPRGV
jgi:hypothetical protein